MFNEDGFFEGFFSSDDDERELSHEDTVLRLEALGKLFTLSGKVSFFIDKEDGDLPSFCFYEDTSFGFKF